MKNILVAFDKFKGSLTSKEACELVKNVLKDQYNVKTLPLADGGEGSLLTIEEALHAKKITGEYHGPDFNKVKGYYLIKDDNAYIEMSNTAGLLLSKIHNPMETTTLGVGEQILDAINKGCKNIYIFLGGSATNDFGVGLAYSLGVKFLDQDNLEFIPVGKTLNKITKIIKKQYSGINFYALCDVDNVLFGENGASYMYAKQKGASEKEVKILDDNLRYLNNLINKDYQNVKGSGAAGGLAGGLNYFFDAKIISGVDFIINQLNAQKLCDWANVIISGEGKVDEQSLHGKVINYFLQNYQEKVVIFCGISTLKNPPFKVIEINPKNETIVESIKNSAYNLSEAIKKYFKEE